MSLTIPFVFAAQAGPIPLSQLDANFAYILTNIGSGGSGGGGADFVAVAAAFPGIYPDGSQDSSAGIQAFVAAVQNAGGTGYIPPGNYVVNVDTYGVTFNLDPTKACTIYGAGWDAYGNKGTRFFVTGAQNFIQAINTTGGNVDCRITIRGIYAHGDATNTNAGGPTIGSFNPPGGSGSPTIVIGDNATSWPFGNWQEHAGKGFFNYNCDGLILVNCMFTNFRGDGGKAVNAYGTVVDDCFFLKNNQNGLKYTDRANSVIVRNCKSYGNGRVYMAGQNYVGIGFNSHGVSGQENLAPEIVDCPDPSGGGQNAYYNFGISSAAANQITSITVASGGASLVILLNDAAQANLVASGITSGTWIGLSGTQSSLALGAPFALVVTAVTTGAGNNKIFCTTAPAADWAAAYPSGGTINASTDPSLVMGPSVIGIAVTNSWGASISGAYSESVFGAAMYIGGDVQSCVVRGGSMINGYIVVDTAIGTEVDGVSFQGVACGIWATSFAGVRAGPNNTYVGGAASQIGPYGAQRQVQNAAHPQIIDTDSPAVSGTYTPTLTTDGTTVVTSGNYASIGWGSIPNIVAPWSWQRIGNTVSLTGIIYGSNSATTNTVVYFSLPVATTSASGTGIGTKSDVYGVELLSVVMNSSPHVGVVQQVAGDSAVNDGNGWRLQFTYTVL